MLRCHVAGFVGVRHGQPFDAFDETLHLALSAMPIPIHEEDSDPDVVKISPPSTTHPSSDEMDEKPKARIDMDEKPKIKPKVEEMSAEELDAHIEATIKKFRARTER